MAPDRLSCRPVDCRPVGVDELTPVSPVDQLTESTSWSVDELVVDESPPHPSVIHTYACLSMCLLTTYIIHTYAYLLMCLCVNVFVCVCVCAYDVFMSVLSTDNI